MAPVDKSFSDVGLVLSGGGSRAAYQVGALKALREFALPDHNFCRVIMGSSIGAVNAVVIDRCHHLGLSEIVSILEQLWKTREFSNTFGNSPTMAFIRTLKLTILKYFSPSPDATDFSLFDPSPLIRDIEEILACHGVDNQLPTASGLQTVGVMTTIEGAIRQGLLLVRSNINVVEDHGLSYLISKVEQLTPAHGFASAALPFVLPPVQLSLETSEVSLVDGGISDNIPVDAAVRFGAEVVISIDVSGKRWWCDHFGVPHYSRDPWEVISPPGSFCMRPKILVELGSPLSFGSVLEQVVGRNTRDRIRVFGPLWPVFKAIQMRVGDIVAFEVMSYVVVHKDYSKAIMQLGYDYAAKVLAESKLVAA